ncbi:PREDICTED: uncharacterized protein LOC108569327, partial [Nicrophorus vespilloides]|uniref:Uncharacterized protein LOC108565191 n=1 Tax=Nicrophorus vespilloides TaxID=110193 RepID=A0ABM1NHM5_NICVS
MDVLWQERLFGKQLTDCSGSKPDTETVEALTDVETVGVYFSFANINLQSDDFRNKLKELYRRLNTSDGSTKRLEIVQVVLWANNDVYSDFEGSHRDSLVDLPWFAMPFSEIDLK